MKIFRILTVAVLMSGLAANAAGQTSMYDYDYIIGINPLLTSGNAAALSSMQDGKVAKAYAGFEKADGALAQIHQSEDCWTATAGTESYVRISDKLCFFGSLSYSDFRGKKMGGPILIDPSYNSVNFLEQDESTAGEKKRETYSVSGALAYSLSDSWAGGLRVDYCSADQTKFKDPRFLNTWMDLSVSAGAFNVVSPSFSFGFDLIFRNTMETISAGLYGTVDREYYILVDQGGFLGTSEIFNGDMGYISDSNARPMSNRYLGAGFQVVVGERIKFYNQLSAFWRTGYFGKKSSSSVVFCENKGPAAEYIAALIVPSGDNLQKVDFKASYELMSNFANSYSFHTEPGKSTEVVYNGQNKQLSRHDISVSAAYSLFLDVEDNLPSWEIGAGVDASGRIGKTTIFPLYRDQSYFGIVAQAYAVRNMLSRSNLFTFGLSVLGGTGFGEPKNDGTMAEGTSKLKSFDSYLNRQFEYETASRAGASISFKYTRLISNALAVYAGVSDSFVSLLSEPEYMYGRFRNAAVLTVGCNF